MSYHPQGYAYAAPPPPQQGSMAALLNSQDSYAGSPPSAVGPQSPGTVQAQGQAAGLVGDEEYNRLLKNYKLAHLRIEEQRTAMLEQEKQNAALRKHIMLLEGGDSGGATVIGVHSAGGGGGSTVDDFTIKNSSSSLERRINRWAADTLAAHVRSAPPPPPPSSHGHPSPSSPAAAPSPSSASHPPSASTSSPHAASPASSSPASAAQSYLALIPLAEALFHDVENASASPFLVGLHQMQFDYPGLGIVVQSLLRHVMSQLLCEGIVNKLLVTNSEEANQELTKLHEQLFHREPLVASVWRRQTFSAAVDSLDPEMSFRLFREHMPHVFGLINPPTSHHHHHHPQQQRGGGADSQQQQQQQQQPVPTIAPELETVLDASYLYSRMLHKSYSPGGALEGSGFYRSFVCQVGSPLDPTQLELIKKCYRTERGEPERVGACLFPGLVKETAIDTTPLPQISIRHGPGAHHGRTIQKKRETRTLVVRRAQVICECALAAAHGIGALPHSAPAGVSEPAIAGQPRLS